LIPQNIVELASNAFSLRLANLKNLYFFICKFKNADSWLVWPWTYNYHNDYTNWWFVFEKIYKLWINKTIMKSTKLWLHCYYFVSWSLIIVVVHIGKPVFKHLCVYLLYAYWNYMLYAWIEFWFGSKSSLLLILWESPSIFFYVL
jgi:hypothetical protein